MNGKFATLLAALGSIAFFASNTAAHPGHSPTDVAAQLAAPLAGKDHLFVFLTVSVLAALAVARLGLHLIDRRKRALALARSK